MNMRGDERDADEMMRKDMECGQNEQMNRMRRGESDMMNRIGKRGNEEMRVVSNDIGQRV